MAVMKGITIKLSETTLNRLRRQARATGRSVAALVRECVEEPRDQQRGDRTVHALAADLAGALAGRRRSATNDRRKFRRS